MDPEVDVGALSSLTSAEPLLEAFVLWLDQSRGVSPVTVCNYGKQIRKFLGLLPGPVEDSVRVLDAGRVTALVVQYCQGRNVWSAKAMVTSLRAFLRFAHATGRTPVALGDAVPAVASWRDAALPSALPPGDVDKLLADGCDRDTVVGRRDHAVLVLLARLGLRSAEVAALRLDDIGWRSGEVIVRGKGDRLERLPLPEQPGAALVVWLTNGRPACGLRSVFTTVRCPVRPLTSESVRAIMRRACDRAGLPRAGAHRLRHSLATEMLRAGASLPQVGQVLRHRSLLSTSIYAKVDSNRLRPLARPWPGSAS